MVNYHYETAGSENMLRKSRTHSGAVAFDFENENEKLLPLPRGTQLCI
jgi:hypothetical protein